MLKRVVKYFIFVFLPYLVTGQNSADWKSILQENKFQIVKDKKEIPLVITREIADTITNIANPKQKWNYSCSTSTLPNYKLNWAATDGIRWIVSYTTGGYSIKISYRLFSPDSNEVIQNIGSRPKNFRKFKKLYLSGKLKEGSLF